VVDGCDYSQLYWELYCVCGLNVIMGLVALITVSCIGNCVVCGSNVVMWLVAVITVSFIANCIACGSHSAMNYNDSI
jgi:hypothetical protein